MKCFQDCSSPYELFWIYVSLKNLLQDCIWPSFLYVQLAPAKICISSRKFTLKLTYVYPLYLTCIHCIWASIHKTQLFVLLSGNILKYFSSYFESTVLLTIKLAIWEEKSFSTYHSHPPLILKPMVMLLLSDVPKFTLDHFLRDNVICYHAYWSFAQTPSCNLIR